MMGRITIAVIPVLALLLVPGGASAARARHAPAKCRPRHSRQFAANAHAQLYVAPEPHSDSNENLGVYGCVYGHRPIFLGPLPYASSSGAGGLEHETLAGTFAAYEESSIGGAESARSEWRVVVRDLRSGRMLHRVPTGQPLAPIPPEYVGVGNVVSLVLKRDGSVAWIADDYGRSRPQASVPEVPYFDVYALDRSGMRLLASGTEIDPHSLSLAGSTLYWTQGGKLASAPLN